VSTSNLYLAYFDTLGFECVINLSDVDKKKMWAALKGEEYSIPAHHLIMRAKANPQRFPEIYTFWSELDSKTILSYTKECPQEFADLLREKGNPVFVTPKQKEIIK
jgi:hypothetical protein